MYTLSLTQGPSIHPQIPVAYPFRQKLLSLAPLKEEIQLSISKKQHWVLPEFQVSGANNFQLVQKHTCVSEQPLDAAFQSQPELEPMYLTISMQQSLVSTQVKALMSYSLLTSLTRPSPDRQQSLTVTSWPVRSGVLPYVQNQFICRISTSFLLVSVTISTPSHCLPEYPIFSLQPVRLNPPESGMQVVVPDISKMIQLLSSTGPQILTDARRSKNERWKSSELDRVMERNQFL